MATGAQWTYERLPLLGLLPFAAAFFINEVSAAEIDAVQDAYVVSTETARRLCDIVRAEGSNRTTKAQAEIGGSLSNLAKKLLGLGFDASVTAGMDSTLYQGVRQEDLAPLLTNQLNCRERVGTALIARLPTPEAPAPRPSAPIIPALNPSLQPKASVGLPGWLRDEQTGCHVWDVVPQPGETVSWSGNCVAGKASGNGTAEWRSSSVVQTVSGTMVEGLLQGLATTIEGNVKYTQPTVDGKPVRGFATVYGPGIQISGDFDPSIGRAGPFGTTVGTAYIVGQNFRYEGPLDSDLRPDGIGILTFQGNPPTQVAFKHGCTILPTGDAVSVLVDISDCTRGSVPSPAQMLTQSQNSTPGQYIPADPRPVRAAQCCFIDRGNWCTPWRHEPDRYAPFFRQSELNTPCYCGNGAVVGSVQADCR